MILLENGKLKGNTTFGSVSQQKGIVEDAVAKAVEESKPLVIHFHGGLVKRANGIKTAQYLQPHYEEAGGVPLFFVWQTGFVETILVNYSEAMSGRFVKWAVKKLLKKLSPKLQVTPESILDRSAVERNFENFDMTEAELKTFEKELEQSAQIDSIASDLQTAVSNGVGKTVPDSDGFRSALSLNGNNDFSEVDRLEAASLKAEFFVKYGEEEGARGLISVVELKAKLIKAVILTVKNVLTRYRNSTDHGLHATCMEELSRCIHGDHFGAAVWGMMKQDSEDSFQVGDECAGTLLLKVIESSPTRPRVLLIGHSAGAVFISNLLRNATTGPFEIALLAPAVTYTHFNHTMKDHSEKIDAFRMYSMTDFNERAATLVNGVPLIYPSSLLYLISGILENDGEGKPDPDRPVLGMQRFFDSRYKARPHDTQLLASVRKFLNQWENGIVWSVADNGPGLSCASLGHGAFIQDPDSQDSLKHLIKAGF